MKNADKVNLIRNICTGSKKVTITRRQERLTNPCGFVTHIIYKIIHNTVITKYMIKNTDLNTYTAIHNLRFDIDVNYFRS